MYLYITSYYSPKKKKLSDIVWLLYAVCVFFCFVLFSVKFMTENKILDWNFKPLWYPRNKFLSFVFFPHQ